MSRCYLYSFKDGVVDEAAEFQNAWLGAAYIWNCIYNTYLKSGEHDTWMSKTEGEERTLWDVWQTQDLREYEKHVLVSTYDYAIVKRENFKQFAQDLRSFVTLHGDWSHLPVWADIIDELEAEAIGFYQMSVSHDPWLVWNPETEEGELYSIYTGDKHFEVYEHVKENKRK